MIPQSHIAFSAVVRDTEVVGVVDMQPANELGVVEVRYRIQVRPISTLGRTAVAVFGRDIVRRQADEFAHCVKNKVGKGLGRPAGRRAGAICYLTYDG